MKDITIREIARQLGMSISTVSCALNYQGGVTFETAETIRRAAREMGYNLPRQGQAPFCGIVLPNKPKYFWDAACQSLCEVLKRGDVPYQAVMYPFINPEDLAPFFSGLDTVVKMLPSVLVVSAPNCAEVKERLQEISVHIPIFLLSEDMDDNRFFYFGNDAQQDSIALAEAFQMTFPDKKRMLVMDMEQYVLRTSTFLSACPELHVVHRLNLPDWHYSVSAILARRIASEVTEPFDCVYCGTGALPVVCLALDKLKVSSDVICIGYENPPGNAKFLENGRIGVTLCQDIAAQSELCAKAVIELKEKGRLPNQQYNYVESQVVYASKG